MDELKQMVEKAAEMTPEARAELAKSLSDAAEQVRKFDADSNAGAGATDPVEKGDSWPMDLNG